MPKFLGAIRAEHQMVEQIVRDQGIDVIISDNRYGCWSGKIRSIFLTHQVKIPMPVGFGWSSSWVNYYSRRAIQQFAEVWIPDQPGSGLTDYFMSDDVHNIRYIGWLSRFEARRGVARKYEIVALVSGPEPQRSIFEGKISSQLLELGLKALLVAGEPQRPYRTMEGCLERVNHLGGQELEDAILSSDIVISRSGYSTIMDLMALGKKAIFIPTTGQPEQLYLAKYLDEQRIAVAMNMNDFSIKLALEKSVGYRGLTGFDRKGNLLSKAIDTLLP